MTMRQRIQRIQRIVLTPLFASVIAVFAFGQVGNGRTQGAEITVLCSNGMKEVMLELGPVFERATGKKLSVEYNSTATIMNQIRSGATADLLILTSEAVDDLLKQGRVVSGSRVDLARSRIAIAVRAGAPKPDIGSPEALKKSLLAMKSVAIPKSGISGEHFFTIIERLGIAAEMKPKIIEVESGPVGTLLAQGQAEIGLQQISELMPVPGIDIVGPLPGNLQKVTIFSAGLATTAKQPAASKALVTFLAGKSAQPVIKKKGMEPR